MTKKLFGVAIAMMNFFNTYGPSKQWGKAIFWTTIIVAGAYVFDYLIRFILLLKGDDKENTKLVGDVCGVMIALLAWQISDKLGVVDWVNQLNHF